MNHSSRLDLNSTDEIIIGRRVILVRPHWGVLDEFLAAVESSRSLHLPWVKPPSTKREFAAYLQKSLKPSRESFLIQSKLDFSLVGVIAVRSILPSIDNSGTLSYYVFEPWSGLGYMKEALANVISFVFKSRKLGCLFAEIEPENTKSISLASRLGFQRAEDVTKFLTDGSFRDYQRWILYADDWFKRNCSPQFFTSFDAKNS